MEEQQHLSRSADRGRAQPYLDYLSYALLAGGVYIRLVQYFSNRSLWYDEVQLALNILDRSYLELLQPLDGNQAAPPLFLWLEKLSIEVFGNYELAFRLPPLLFGLAALFLFFILAKQYLEGIALPIAIALFSFLKYTVYFAGETKPYSTDLAVALLLFLVLTAAIDRRSLGLPEKLAFAVLGAICIWLSFPSIFVLAAVELVGWLRRASVRAWLARLFDRLPVYGTWLAAFGGLYFVVVASTLTNEQLTESWGARYPDTPWDVVWLLDALGRFFSRPMGFQGYADGVAMMAFVIGLLYWYGRDRWGLALLNAPLLVTLLAAFLHQYPFRERLVLFLVPFASIVVAAGIAAPLVSRQRQHWLLRGFGFVLVGILVVAPVVRVGRLAVAPGFFHFDHLRPVLAAVRSEWEPGDRLLVLQPAQPQFQYYRRRFNFQPADYRLLPQPIPKQAEGLRGPAGRAYRQAVVGAEAERVWILLARRNNAFEDALLADLDGLGRQLAVFRQHDALACLYELDAASTKRR